MVIELDINKIPSILKECFLYYSFKIGNYTIKDNKKIYNFNYTENSSLYNFSDFIKQNKEHYLNIDWLFDYFNYQFTYWSFIKKEKEKNTNEIYLIQLHWILGKKALKRFNTRTSKDSYFYHSNFFPCFQIRKKDIIANLESKKLIFIKEDFEENKKIEILNNLDKKEEEIKKRKYNTLVGFGLCLNFTTLFRFSSELCQKCKYKKKCKKCLKENYPKLYQKRIIQNFAQNKIKNGNKN